jgi:mono/diheme cytochrome c family protein
MQPNHRAPYRSNHHQQSRLEISMYKSLGFTVCVLLATASAGAAETPSQKPAADTNSAESGAKVDAKTYAGWQAVRANDCARCHGAQYTGQVGPSLIESVKTRDKSAFINIILEGNLQRGMPGYKTVPGVADNVEGIYAYFKAMADGKIKPGKLTKGE